MRCREIVVHIVDYQFSFGVDPTEIEISASMYAELRHELNTTSGAPILIKGVVILIDRHLSSHTITLKGPPGVHTRTLVSQYPPPPPPPPTLAVNKSTQIMDFVSKFTKTTGGGVATLAALSPTSFAEVMTELGAPSFSRTFKSGMSRVYINYLTLEVCNIPGVPDDICELFENENSTPYVYYFGSVPTAQAVTAASITGSGSSITFANGINLSGFTAAHALNQRTVPIIYGKPEARSGCECGADKCGQPNHSTWCPKHGV